MDGERLQMHKKRERPVLKERQYAAVNDCMWGSVGGQAMNGGGFPGRRKIIVSHCSNLDGKV